MDGILGIKRRVSSSFQTSFEPQGKHTYTYTLDKHTLQTDLLPPPLSPFHSLPPHPLSFFSSSLPSPLLFLSSSTPPPPFSSSSFLLHSTPTPGTLRWHLPFLSFRNPHSHLHIPCNYFLHSPTSRHSFL